MKKKGLIGIIASFGCFLNLMSFGAYADTYTDGTYTGTAMGYADYITVEVTVSNGVISNIEITSHDDTPDYIEVAEDVINDIISTNSTDVDAVSGATYSSNGIIDAVKDALSNASAPAETEATTTTADTTTSQTENTDATTSSVSDTTTTTTTTTNTGTSSSNSSSTTTMTTKSNSSSSSTSSGTNEVSVETTSLETGDHSLIGIVTAIGICAVATFGVSAVKKKAKK